MYLKNQPLAKFLTLRTFKMEYGKVFFRLKKESLALDIDFFQMSKISSSHFDLRIISSSSDPKLCVKNFLHIFFYENQSSFRKIKERSCQFHQHYTRAFFIRKFYAKIFGTYILGLSFFWCKNIGANALLKCWWNWHEEERCDVVSSDRTGFVSWSILAKRRKRPFLRPSWRKQLEKAYFSCPGEFLKIMLIS
jgi:hypothetical protein